MSWGNDARRFLAQVVPWPSGELEGYVNLHWQVKREDGTSFWLGSPHTTLDDLISKVNWLVSNGMVDVFYCTSLQSQTKQNKSGKIVAHRDGRNAVAMKAFWLDLDVKEGAYADLTEAVLAANAFCTGVKLPRYNAAVASGGGLHLYWILDNPITPAEWKVIADALKRHVLASGLHCDVGCTVDAARILRVPESFNTKLADKRPVRLLRLEDKLYRPGDFSHLVAAVTGGGNAAAFPPRLSSMQMEIGNEGVEPRKNVTPDPIKVLKECPLLHTVFETGGAECGQPLWNLTTLAASFLPNGEKFAHAFAKGHKDYSHASTDALYKRKEKEKAEKSIGWPSCQAFQTAGSTHCGNCPHFAAGKSPLNLGVVGFASVPISAYHGLHLPDGYCVNQQGQICMRIDKKKKVEKEDGTVEEYDDPSAEPLFLNKHWQEAWSEKGTEDVLHFTLGVGKGDYRQAAIPASQIQSGEFWKSPSLGLRTAPHGTHPRVKNFFMAWLHKLEEVRGSVEQRSYGWSANKKTFAYGRRVYHGNGKYTPAAYRDPVIQRELAPVGDIGPFMKAAKFTTDQNRPGAELLLATTFASPLFIFTGQNGCMHSVHGEGGEGKSTTAQIAQAVWGHPKLAKNALGSTAKSMASRMGKIGHLPLYWDEIRDTAHQKQVSMLLAQLSEGQEASRLIDGRHLQAKGDWQTMLIAMSNKAFMDYLVSEQRQTTAWFYRVVEYKLPPFDTERAIDGIDMHSFIEGPLYQNYGRMGERYAEYMADNAGVLQDRINAVGKSFEKDARITAGKERFWGVWGRTLLLGMELANECGLEFNIKKNREYMLHIIDDMRRRVAVETCDDDRGVESALTDYLRDTRIYTIGTDTFLRNGGRRTGITCYNPLPSHMRSQGRKVFAQYSDDPSVLRISRRHFREWMHETKRNPSTIIAGLKRLYGAEEQYAELASGLDYDCGREWLIVLNIVPGDMLDTNRAGIRGTSPFMAKNTFAVVGGTDTQ